MSYLLLLYSQLPSTPDSVSVALNDITESIDVAELGVSVMDQLAGSVADGQDAWSERKRFIEGEVIRPLRSYRGQMLPHQEQLIQKLNHATEDESPEFEMSETETE